MARRCRVAAGTVGGRVSPNTAAAPSAEGDHDGRRRRHARRDKRAALEGAGQGPRLGVGEDAAHVDLERACLGAAEQLDAAAREPRQNAERVAGAEVRRRGPELEGELVGRVGAEELVTASGPVALVRDLDDRLGAEPARRERGMEVRVEGAERQDRDGRLLDPPAGRIVLARDPGADRPGSGGRRRQRGADGA